MKTYHISGHKISNSDKKALAHFMIEDAKTWSSKALAGMINKAKKTIIKDWFDKYRATQTGDISTDPATLIPAIVAMPEFTSYKYESPEKRKPERTEDCDEEVWENGFAIEDWEDIALKAFYIDPEQTLKDLMENKVALWKQAFLKEIMADSTNATIPSKIDEAIQMQIRKDGYKTALENSTKE